MTLDVKALLKNLLKKQMSIQHFTAKTEVFASKSLPKRIKDKIVEEFGDQFLLDANYVVFFRGDIDKEGMKKLFNLTNKAFGEDANRLTEGDFKKISFAAGGGEEAASGDPTKEDKPSEEDAAEKAEDTAAPEEDADSTALDDEVDAIVNEDEESLDEDIQVDSTVDSYVFLKITTK